MRRFSIFCTLLLVFTTALLCANEWLNRHLLFSAQVSATYKKYRLFYESHPTEIPILGSSRAAVHIIPSRLSSQAFNYGVDGEPIHETLFLLRYIAAIPSRTPVLVNLDPWGFHEPVSPFAFLSEAYSLVGLHPYVVPHISFTPDSIANYIPGIRFYGSLRQNFQYWRESRTSKDTHLDHGARLFSHRRSKKEWTFIQQKERGTSFTYQEARWAPILHDIYLHAQRPIVWLVAPVAPYYRRQYVGLNTLQTFLKEQVKHPNVTVFDAFTNTTYDYELFKDATHLNLWGAERYTDEIRNFLLAKGLLPAFRSL